MLLHWTPVITCLVDSHNIILKIKYHFENSIEIDREWHECVVAVSQDDKTSVPVSRSTPVSALARNSTRVIASVDTTISVCDHDFTSEKFVPSVNAWMNIGENLGKKLAQFIFNKYFF